MNILQITLQHKRDSLWPVSATFTSTEGLPYRREGILKFDDSWEGSILALNLQPEKYGEFIGKALFQNDIRDICKEALAAPDQTRLFLIVEDPQLKALRWERLSFPDDVGEWISLAQHQRLLFSFYLPSLVSRRYPAISKHSLKALTFIASPIEEFRGYKPFNVKEFATTIEKSLDPIEQHLLSEPKETTWKHLKETLNQQHYPILHIVAHGMYQEEMNETFLIFLDEQRQPEAISSKKFIDALRRMAALPNLIFLSSCETASPKAAKGSHGHLARTLLDKLGTPAIVAMSDKVNIDTARLLSEKFYQHLLNVAYVDEALAKAGEALLEQDDRHLPVLYQRLGYRPLFSLEPKLLKDLNKEEIDNGLARLDKLIELRAPICKEQFNTLKNRVAQADYDLLDLHKLDQLCAEITETSFSALAQDEPVPDYNAECPFPGMRPFKQFDTGSTTDIDYRKYFFGREKKVAELVEKINKKPVFAIKGASGSGKSSIVFAGILPALEKTHQANGEQLQIVTMTPACAVQSAEQTKTPNDRLQHLLKEINPEQPAIVYVDQFEELFTSCQYKDHKKQENIRKEFLNNLLELPNSNLKLKVILTIRADFVGECSDYENLRLVMQNESDLLPRMTQEELRTAIEQQANQVGLIFEGNLIHQILDEVDGEPGAMPLLQHLLWILWERRRGRYLRKDEYDNIGGVTKAISETANKVYDSYEKGSKEQKYLRNIFIRLTRPDKERTKDDENNFKDTRQRVNRKDLFPNDADPKIIEDLINRLATERLIVTKENEVEIAHESLIRYWEKLKSWLYDRSLILVRQEVADATQAWRQHKKADLLQHRGSRIETIEDYKKNDLLFLNNEEEQYLEACKKEDQKQKRNKKLLKITLSFAIIFLVFSIFLLSLSIGLKNNVNDQLANTYFQKGLEFLKNSNHENEKANLYITKALDAVSNKNDKEKFLFSHLGLHTISPTPELEYILRQKYISGVTFFANEQRMLTWSEEGSVRVWETNTGEALSKPMVHEKAINGVTLFANEQRILTWSEDGTARVWDSNTGEALSKHMMHEKAINGATLFANEQRILTWSEDGTARVWDSNTGKALGKPIVHMKEISSATLFAKEQRVLTRSWDGTARVWNTNTGEATSKPMKHKDQIYGTTLFADEHRVLTWSEDGTARIWDTNTGEALSKPMVYEKWIEGATLFAGEQRVLIWSEDGTARVWDTNTGEALSKFMVHDMAIKGATLFYDEQRVLTWSEDGTARIWDTNTGGELSKPMVHEKRIRGATLFADEQRVLTWSNDGTARIWETKTGEALSQPIAHENQIKGATLFADEQRVLIWSKDGTVRIWDVNSGEALTKAMRHKESVRFAMLFANEQQALVWGADGTVHVWSTKTNKILSKTMVQKKRIIHSPLFGNVYKDKIQGASFFSDEQRVLIWSEDGTARIWDTNTGEVLSKSIVHKDQINGATLFAGEQRVLIWSEDGTVRVWNTNTGEALTKPMVHKKQIKGTTLFSDEQRVLTWSEDAARIWDTNTGEPLSEFMGHTGQTHSGLIIFPGAKTLEKHIKGTSLFADEQQVLIWNKLGIVDVWDINTGEMINKYEELIEGVTLFTDEQRMLTWNKLGKVRIMDADTGKVLSKTIVHVGGISGATLLANQQRVLTWGKDGTGRIWNVHTGEQLGKPMEHSDEIKDTTLFSNEQRVLTWTKKGIARIWDTNTGEALSKAMMHEKAINGVSLFANEQRVLIWNNNIARVWDTSSGDMISEAIEPKDGIYDAMLSSNGRRLLILSDQDSIRSWSLPMIPKKNAYLYEINEAIASGTYFNASNDLSFFTAAQLLSCKNLYFHLKKCEESNNLGCKFNRQVRWPIQKFFGKLPTIEDCLSSKGSSP